jgi:hypothetical protein
MASDGKNGPEDGPLDGIDAGDEGSETAQDEAPPESHEPLPPAPAEVEELARACVEFVRKATTMELDFTAETLPILDHYVRGAREQSEDKTEVLTLLAPPVGCYLGEVARRRLRARWFAPPGEHRIFRLELSDAFLSTNPIGLAMEALLLEEVPGWGARFRLRPEDEPIAERSLANFPDVEAEDYYAPSSRLETMEIIVDALIAHQLSKVPAGEAPRRWEERDYGWTRAEAIADAEGRGVGLA